MTEIIVQRYEIDDNTWSTQTSEAAPYDFIVSSHYTGGSSYAVYNWLPEGGWKPLTVVQSTIRGYINYNQNYNTSQGVHGVYVPFYDASVPEGKFVARFMFPVQGYDSPAVTGWFDMAFYKD